MSTSKFRSMILVSRNVKNMWIFAGFLGGASKNSAVVDDDIFGAN